MAQSTGGDLSKAALDSKMVDRLGERREFEARLAELGGKDAKADGGYSQVRYADYAKRALDAAPTGPIGVVHVAGMIVDGKASSGTAGGETIAGLIDDAVATGKLKALVVRIDSPGGSVTASERIRQSILGAKAAGLPVVVSMGSVAASGGYWITTPADYVFAEPETITGSIGVFGVVPTFEGTLAKLGVTTDGIATTPLAGQPDILGGLNPEAEQLMQAGIASTYGRFIGLVAKARHKTPQEVDRIAQGRVWDGGTARQIGLVDGFGSLDAAVAKAAALAKLGDERGVTWIDKGPSFQEQLVEYLAGEENAGDDTSSDAFALLAPAPADVLERAFAEAAQILSGPSMQAVCLECPPPAARRPATAKARSLLGLFGWGGRA
jgi:protease-4